MQNPRADQEAGLNLWRNAGIKEAWLFFGVTLGLVYLVCWGPLAVTQTTAISFVSGKTGPGWAVALYLLGGFTPSLAAVALTGIREGRAGLKRLWGRVIQVRIAGRWYAAAAGLALLTGAGQIAIIRLLGQSFDLSLFAQQLFSLIPLIIIGPLSEELGWRGYALDRLQTRWTPLVSGLVVGVMWSLWHLPLFYIPGTSQYELSFSFVSFLIATTSMSVLFTWLHNHAGGSIWMAIYFHWLYTYVAQVVASGVTRTPLYNALEFAPMLLLAVGVGLTWRKDLLRRPGTG